MISEIERLRPALHPLARPPREDGWNLAELDGLLPAGLVATEAAVLVGLVARGSGPSVILTRRTEGMRQHPGQVSFPGGRVEPGDAGALDAALREADEEIGLPAAQALPMGWLDPLTTISGYRVLPVVARIAEDFVPVPDPREVAEVFEVPLAFLLSPDSLRRVEIELGGRVRQVLEFRPHRDAARQRIWGATASILFNLRQRLEALR